MERNAAPGSKQCRIADLLLDVGRQRVTRADVEISLPKLSFDLLLAMVRAAPNVVSIDALMTEVWPGIVVSPETVSQRVKLLRDALGDDPRSPRYIAGVRGRGYRLIPDVEWVNKTWLLVDHATTPRPARAVDSDSNPRWRGHRTTLVGILIGVTVIAAAAFISISRSSFPHPPAASREVILTGLPPRTVAVLPFQNLSSKPENDYLALGVAEMVLNRLASEGEVVVIARSSSFTFRDADADAPAIGRKLGARYLVEGSVQREGEKLRITANLIDAESGSQLEALRFDGTMKDIFSIQDEIADKVAAALEMSLADMSPDRGGARSGNLEAYLAYLRGRALLQTWSATDSDAAAKQFEKAINLDRGFAAAYVGLADALMQAWHRKHDTPEGHEAGPTMRRVRALIDKALTLDPSLGAAYLARAHSPQQDPARIEADFRKGLQLDPANGRGLTGFYEFLIQAGRREEARRVLDRALVVDPLSARARYLEALDFTDSVMEFEHALLEVLKIDPNFTSALARLGEIRWKLRGEFAEGAKLVERAIAIDPQTPWLRHTAYLMYVDMGDLAAARDVSEASAESAGNARFQMFQYLGEWRAAGEAAYEVPAWLRGHYSNWNDAEAVRDLALRSSEYARAIRFIESDHGLGKPRKITAINASRAVPLAHLLLQSGERQACAALLEDILAWLDGGELNASPWARGVHRIRANAFALQGNRDAALAELEKAFRSGDRRLWWYTVERDPLYADMRSDPRFQAIAAEARAHAAGQRALLQEMRRKGEAPARPSSSVEPIRPGRPGRGS